ncbi:MAG: hypothetical protein J0M19_05620 [Sphingomonadales bacterium]|nr:hypothetical protein [Sphingomonadales bacterium]
MNDLIADRLTNGRVGGPSYFAQAAVKIHEFLTREVGNSVFRFHGWLRPEITINEK